MTDVFDIQDEITLAIVKQLKVELLAKKQENLESYNLYSKVPPIGRKKPHDRLDGANFR